jgi:putative ABC transport system ATP-binding protein
VDTVTTRTSSTTQRPRAILNGVTAVLLLLTSVHALLALTDRSPSLFPHLPDPLPLLLHGALLAGSLLGALAVVAFHRLGAYLALLLATAQLVLGGYALSNVLTADPLNVTVLLQALVALTVGGATILTVYAAPPTLAPRRALPARGAASPSAGASTAYAVEVEELTKRYAVGPIEVHAINGISLRIRRGEFVAIMGPSGSGKSTLMHLIGVLDRPSSGRVLIDGVDVSTLDDAGLARLRNERIGFVFQAYNLITRSSVLRNMELPAFVRGDSKTARQATIAQLLTSVGLADKAPRKPKTMSGGEQQRVAIARALVNDPAIILADEPTGNLDTKTGMEVVNILRSMNRERGTTVITVTHDHDVARMADRIIHLRDGHIVDPEHPTEGVP